jgi:hypothetical protein
MGQLPFQVIPLHCLGNSDQWIPLAKPFTQHGTGE